MLLAALGGCSMVRLSYGQAPDLVYWWIDGYVDFTDEQSPRAREAIAAWFRWHRSTQLPEYAALLARAQAEVADPATPQQACRWYGELRARYRTAIEHALSAVADSVRSLSAEQLRHLQRRYDKGNKEFAADYLQATPRDRLRASVERALDRAEMLYGRLDGGQRERVGQLVAESPFDADRWLVERKLRQQAVLQTLNRLHAQRQGADEALAALRVLVDRTLSSPRPAYRDYQQRLQQYNCAFAAQLHNLATPAQRAHAVKKLRAWEEDMRSLASDAP